MPHCYVTISSFIEFKTAKFMRICLYFACLLGESFAEESYGRVSDSFSHCIENYKIGRCLKRKLYTVYCDSCGWVTVAEYEESCCELRDVFYRTKLRTSFGGLHKVYLTRIVIV